MLLENLYVRKEISKKTKNLLLKEISESYER